MKQLALLLVIITMPFCSFGVTYTTDGANSWDANGAPPAGWQAGIDVVINHAITNMTAYTWQPLNGSSTLTINSGGSWDIANITFGDGTSTVTINSGGTLDLSGAFSMSQSSIDVQSGGTFNIGGSTATYTGGSLTVNGEMNVTGDYDNDIAIGGTGVINVTGTVDNTGSFSGTLPVELSFFSAFKDGENVAVKWQTASEINSDYFKIMKSVDGIHFEEIGEVSAAGYSSEIIDYEFTDHAPALGANYYQLIETDYDGTTQYSEVVFLNFEDKGSINASVFPNPATTDISLTFQSSSAADYNTFKIINSVGQLVNVRSYVTEKGLNILRFDVSNYNKGIYYILLLNPAGEQFASTQFVVK